MPEWGEWGSLPITGAPPTLERRLLDLGTTYAKVSYNQHTAYGLT